MGEFRMPSLGADMDAGTVVEWKVKPGDVVHRGDIVVIVDTEKSTIEAEIFEDGIVDELLVAEGQEVPVGTVLARIRSGPAGADAAGATPEVVGSPQEAPGVEAEITLSEGAPAAPIPAGLALRPATSEGAPVPLPVRAEPGNGHVRATPRARREAEARQIDLRTVTGTGPEGAVTVEDVEQATRAAVPADRGTDEPEPEVADRQAAMRRAIGRLMARSKREIPHYYLATTVDMTRALDWLDAHNRELSVDRRVLPAALLLKATALAATEVRGVNGFWLDDHLEDPGAIHLGVAVSLRGGGLVAPAVHDAATLSIDELMGRFKDLVLRARAGRLRGSEMSDPTITVTNLGDQGVEEVFGVIYAPQVALVGFGKIVERPWAEHGMVGCRQVVRATLSADHRASDGHVGARFLATIDRLLQQPEAL